MPNDREVSRRNAGPVAVRQVIGHRAIMTWPRQSNHWLALNLLLLLAGCATLVIDSSDIEVEAVEYGLFEPAEEAFRHVETRIDIACEPGTIFGVGYRLIFRHGAHGRLPLEFSVHQPTPTSGLTAPADGPSVLHVEPTVPRGARFGDVQVLEIIDGQNALHSGRYEFVVRVPEKDVVLDKRSFVLSGCENPADAGPGR